MNGRRWRIALALIAIVACSALVDRVRGELTVATDFEGASAKVVRIDQATKLVKIMPGGDPEQGWPCWWYLRVDGLAAGDRLTLEVAPSDAKLPRHGPGPAKTLPGYWAMPLRATYSSDCKTWRHSEPGRILNGNAQYTFKVESEKIWLAWGPPFTPSDSAALCKEIAEKCPGAEAFELARSRGDRPCPALRIKAGELPLERRSAIWLQARQHAWESGSSWVCAGVARWLASDDVRARKLRENHEIFLVPIVDIDRTATGNGGKESVPRDHNRDWTDKPYHHIIAGAQKRLLELCEAERLALFIDLHNPGPFDKQPFFFCSPESELKEIGRRNQERFLVACSAELTGPLELARQPRTSGPAYDPLWKQMSKNWVLARAPPSTVALTLETPWDTRHSTTEGYQTVGTQLGLAIERYLREDPHK